MEKNRNEKLISIIVPVYNVEKYIVEALDSITIMNLENIEIILVDDGSKDNSGEICDNYANRYDYISAYHVKNGGVSSARNIGISYANGKYIVFFDPDDIMNSDIILKIENYFAEDVDMITFMYEKINENGKKYEWNYQCIENKKYEKYEFINKYYRNFRTIPCFAWQSIYKTDIILKNKILFPMGISIAEDADFYMQYIKKISGKVLFKNEPLIKYRINRSGSATTCVKKKTVKDAMKIYEKYSDVEENPVISEKFVNLYKDIIFLIAKVDSKEERKLLSKEINMNIINRTKEIRFNLFKICCYVIGKANAIEILRKYIQKTREQVEN